MRILSPVPDNHIFRGLIESHAVRYHCVHIRPVSLNAENPRAGRQEFDRIRDPLPVGLARKRKVVG